MPRACLPDLGLLAAADDPLRLPASDQPPPLPPRAQLGDLAGSGVVAMDDDLDDFEAQMRALQA